VLWEFRWLRCIFVGVLGGDLGGRKWGGVVRDVYYNKM
jgi:hypothetical protein